MYSKRSLFFRSKGTLILVPLLTLLLASWLSSSTFAQSIDSPWIIYKQEDGLASNSVWMILPTEGEIWFGTDNGISRFNGEWKSWRKNSGFVEGTVLSLSIGGSPNTIWAGTDQGVLLLWDGARWNNVLTFSDAIQALQLVNGELWIGAGSGLYIWKGTEAVAVDTLRSISVQSLAVHASTVCIRDRLSN